MSVQPLNPAYISGLKAGFQAYRKDKAALAEAERSGDQAMIRKATEDIRKAREALKNDMSKSGIRLVNKRVLNTTAL